MICFLFPNCLYYLFVLGFYWSNLETIKWLNREVNPVANYIACDVLILILSLIINLMPMACPSKSSAECYMWATFLGLTTANVWLTNKGFTDLYSEEYVMKFVRQDIGGDFAWNLYALLYLRLGFVSLTLIFSCLFGTLFAMIKKLISI